MIKHALPGSERQPMRGALPAGDADPEEPCQVSVILRHTDADGLRTAIEAIASDPSRGSHLRREDFRRRFAASADDIAAVRGFAAANGLTVLRAMPEQRTVTLCGTVAACSAAFDVRLQRFEHPHGTYRGRTGPVHVPDSLSEAVEAVLGLDNRPAARPYIRARRRDATRADGGCGMAFSPSDLAGLYGFPPGNGNGQCVGIIELGGGYRTADLLAYCARLGIDTLPRLVSVPVNGGQNQPTGDTEGSDGEVMLDIEVLAAIVPAAKLAVYFAPNTDAGFLAALNAAVHDTVNQPSVISISWGGPEPAWTPQAMTAFDSTLQAAAAMGITVCAAAGDSGSSDGASDGTDHADFPASSPHVLACGGTTLLARQGAIASETVWNDAAQGGGSGGGGVSAMFAAPTWQTGLAAETATARLPLTMRGVPDVCGNADPATGYTVRIDGTDTVLGGTSAVAPLWAGLLTRINAACKQPVGFINPLLYRTPDALRDITGGNNGDYAATPGWDACTGLGSPNGPRLSALLGAAPAGRAVERATR